ncbi:ABC transporter substrate-binding protein [Haemophilus paracuniculus]|uniref:ABC transporter substrate-binding protein n=1 Tax=Haemophilus paracuniculus TaxID=734 RepID=UPI0009944DE0
MKSRIFKALQAVSFALFFAPTLLAKSPCIATLDWTVAETLLAFDEPRFCAVGDVKSYQHWVAEPKLPAETVDLGIRLQPNPEQIWALARTHSLQFINTSFYGSATPLLNQFTDKVAMVDFYGEGKAWHNILTATQQVANLIGKPEQAVRLHQKFSQKIAEIRPLVTPFTDRPILLVQFIDSRHLRIYAENSPFGEVLKQLGFRNGWNGSHNNWGFETVSVTQLASLPNESRLVVVKPYPSNISTALQYNTLWQKLAMAKDPLILPAVWTFGGVPSAQRFAEVLANGLIEGGEQW